MTEFLQERFVAYSTYYSLSAFELLRHDQLIPAQFRTIHRAELGPPIKEILKTRKTEVVAAGCLHSVVNRVEADPTLRNLFACSWRRVDRRPW